MALVLLGAVAQALGECPEGFFHLSEGCYSFGSEIGEEPMSQLDAQDFCATFGGHLAEFDTCTDFEHVLSYLSLHGLSSGEIWIGAHATEGAWTWESNGDSLYYGAPLFDPTYVAQEGDDCAVLPGTGGYMLPDNCEHLHIPFCEAPVVRGSGEEVSVSMPRVECPEPFVEVAGRCFYVNDEFLSWDNARARCAELGDVNIADLAVLEDCTSFGQIAQYIEEQKGPAEWIWVGARDFDGTGLQHQWLSGVNVAPGPSFWCPGQPNNFMEHQACVMLWGRNSYYGADEDCSVFHKSLCEIGY